MTVTAYYVSPTGSDNNAGTLNAPFATFARAQQAMENSSIKTTYILGGNYSPNATESSAYGSAVLNLTSADSGETWSYYPADGYGSANITGGGNISTFMELNGATGVTVNGLNISNFTNVGIYATDGASNATIINNTVHDMSQLGIAIDDQGASVNNTLISNNDVYNTGYDGIAIYSVHGHGNYNNTISNNMIENTDTVIVGGGNPYSDGGGIYAMDLNASASTGNVITGNYIGESHGVAIYFDDGASNYTVTDNVLDPGATAFALVQLHGGNNNVFSGNIGDESTGLLDGFVFYQPSINPAGNRGMTGNVWEDNVLVGDIASGGGAAYTGSLDPSNPLTIKNNDYWNYGAGGNLRTTGTDGAGNDSNPSFLNPQISGSNYTIAGGSPVFGSPVNFPGITDNWGPSGSGASPPPPPPPPSSPPPPPPSGSTTITGVSWNNATESVVISGSGFGAQNPYNGDSEFIEVADSSRGWNAGFAGNLVTLNVTSWTNSQIVISGFTGSYGNSNWTFQPGDQVVVGVSNANGTPPPNAASLTAQFTETVPSTSASTTITGVSWNNATESVVISGSGFGAQNAYTGDTPFLELADKSGGWNAGFNGNLVTLNVTSWTNSQIVISGFTGSYGNSNWTFQPGDQVVVGVSNANGTPPLNAASLTAQFTETIPISGGAGAATGSAAVTDPPSGTTGGDTSSAQTIGSGQQTPDLALLSQYSAAGFASQPDPGSSLVAAAAPAATDQPALLTNPLH